MLRLRFTEDAHLAYAYANRWAEALGLILEILFFVDRKYLNVRLAWSIFKLVGVNTYEPNILAANAKSGPDFVSI